MFGVMPCCSWDGAFRASVVLITNKIASKLVFDKQKIRFPEIEMISVLFTVLQNGLGKLREIP